MDRVTDALWLDVIPETFTRFDVDHSGCIDAWELKEAMKSLGQNLTDEDLFALLAQVDTARSPHPRPLFITVLFRELLLSRTGWLGKHRFPRISSGFLVGTHFTTVRNCHV